MRFSFTGLSGRYREQLYLGDLLSFLFSAKVKVKVILNFVL
jgi:hypothetical protein